MDKAYVIRVLTAKGYRVKPDSSGKGLIVTKDGVSKTYPSYNSAYGFLGNYGKKRKKHEGICENQGKQDRG